MKQIKIDKDPVGITIGHWGGGLQKGTGVGSYWQPSEFYFFGNRTYIDLDQVGQLWPDVNGYSPVPLVAIIGHELGHDIMGDLDDGKNDMNNVNKNENPIRKSFGIPNRTGYSTLPQHRVNGKWILD